MDSFLICCLLAVHLIRQWEINSAVTWWNIDDFSSDRIGDLLRPRDGADGAEALVFHNAISTSFQREIHLPEEFPSLPGYLAKINKFSAPPQKKVSDSSAITWHESSSVNSTRLTSTIRRRLLGTPSVYQSTLELTPTSYKDHCKRLYYLVEKQRELCGLSQNVLAVSTDNKHL